MLAEDFSFSQAQWDDLAIPVDLVFLFQQSDARRMSTRHGGSSRATPVRPARPSPSWTSPPGRRSPRRTRRSPTSSPTSRPYSCGATATATFTCLVVPIDACYELVGLVRQYWAGFQGGDEVWQRIDEFFDQLLARAGAQGG